jgi:hypothetical protein
MRATYKALGHTIAGLVAVQAAGIALAVFGLLNWVDDGHSFTPALAEDRAEGVTGAAGFLIHSIGANLIALLAIVLLIVSFFAKIPGGVKWASFMFAAVLVQYVVAIVSFGVPVLGLVHGVDAILIAWLGWHAAKVAGLATDGTTTTEAAVAR